MIPCVVFCFGMTVAVDWAVNIKNQCVPPPPQLNVTSVLSLSYSWRFSVVFWRAPWLSTTVFSPLGLLTGLPRPEFLDRWQQVVIMRLHTGPTTDSVPTCSGK